MRYAVAGAAGDLVDALLAVTRRDYSCPTCGGAVFLRSGLVREAHFAHYEAEGSEACEDYRPGPYVDVSQPVPDADEVPDELPLIVEHDGSAWRVFLKLPEVPGDELRETDLAQLRTGSIAIFAGDTLLATVSGLDVRPGVDAARVLVSPSATGYRAEAIGEWPARISRARWARIASPFAVEGMLFRSRSGEWARLAASARVHWGEELVLVASEQATPPPALDAAPAGAVLSDGVRWRLWRCKLPAALTEAVEKWLKRLGYRAEPPSWDAEILSVPASHLGAHDSFYSDSPIIGVLSPPHGSSRTLLTTTSRGNARTVTIEARSTSPLYATMDVGASCEVDLELVGEGATALSFTTIEKPTLEELTRALQASPRLAVRVGDRTFLAWDADQGRPCPRQGDVSIETGVSGSRVTITVIERATRRQYRGLAPQDAQKVISDALRNATSIEVEAGNLGCIAIRPRVESAREAPARRSRLHAWLRVAALQSVRTGPEFGVLPIGRDQVVRYRDERLLSQARALLRAERRHTGGRQ